MRCRSDMRPRVADIGVSCAQVVAEAGQDGIDLKIVVMPRPTPPIDTLLRDIATGDGYRLPGSTAWLKPVHVLLRGPSGPAALTGSRWRCRPRSGENRRLRGNRR